MEPPPFSSIAGISYFMHKNALRRSMSRIRDHSILGDVDEGCRRLFDTGVVERDIEATELLDRLLDDGLDVAGGGHVAFHGEHPPTVLGDESSGLVVAGGVDVGQDHVRAFGCEGDRRGAADAAAGTGHEGDLSGEPAFSHLLVSLSVEEVEDSVPADPTAGRQVPKRVGDGRGQVSGVRQPRRA